MDREAAIAAREDAIETAAVLKLTHALFGNGAQGIKQDVANLLKEAAEEKALRIEREHEMRDEKAARRRLIWGAVASIVVILITNVSLVLWVALGGIRP